MVAGRIGTEAEVQRAPLACANDYSVDFRKVFTKRTERQGLISA